MARNVFRMFTCGRLGYAAIILGSAVLSDGAAATPLAAAAVAPAVQSTPAVDSDLRLATIGYHLSHANAFRCAQPDILTGLLLHDAASYAERDRAAIMATYGLGYGFGVLAVVPESAGARAGLREGDELLAVDGVDLQAFARDKVAIRASFDRIRLFTDLLASALRRGDATLMVRRGSTTVNVVLSADHGCGGEFVLVPSGSLNAWSDGRYVAVTDRMMRFVLTDDELAFVVAHEMSHNILEHRSRLEQRRTLFATGLVGGRPALTVKRTEMEADSYAVGLLASAGYNLAAPDQFLTRASRARPFDMAISHPGTRRRIAIVDAAIARVMADPARDVGRSAAPALASTPAPWSAPAWTAASWPIGSAPSPFTPNWLHDASAGFGLPQAPVIDLSIRSVGYTFRPDTAADWLDLMARHTRGTLAVTASLRLSPIRDGRPAGT